MRGISSIAGSLLLSTLNAIISGVALLVAYSGLSPWWGAVMIWIIAPPLLLLTGGYLIFDLIRPVTRKQALVAAALFAPIAVIDCYFRFRGI